MLKLTNDKELLTSGLREEHILFYQVWKELTASKTFDTYQYKSMNVLNGISELLHNIGAYLDGSSYTTHSIICMCEELLDLLKKDPVMANSFPAIKNRLIPSLSKGNDNINQLNGLRYQLLSYYPQLEEKYDSALTVALATAVNAKTPEQTGLSSQFISRCIDLGWSVKALAGKVEALKTEPAKNEDIQNFLSKIINAKKQTYVIIIPFRLKVTPKEGKTKDEARDGVIERLRSFGIEVSSYSSILETYPGIDNSCLTESQKYMIVQTESLDLFSASHDAIVKLSMILNILSFFTTIESWTVSDISLIAYNLSAPYTKSLKATDIYKTYEYLDSSSKVYKRTADLISKSGYEQQLAKKLLASFSYANLSRASMALEEKYMNIWIAIESLCRSIAYDNIIGSVITLVPNASCLRYIYRIVRNFVEDCDRCEVSFSFSQKVIDVQMDNKEQLVKETIEVFRDPVLCVELNEKCKCNTLLHHRYEDLYSLLTDEQIMISRIKAHHQNVVWHLNRLYRIRNEIAHVGSLQGFSAIRYTEHAYDYLATLVSEIVRFSYTNAISGPNEVFSLINDNYNEFLNVSAAKKPIDKRIALAKLWTNGIIDYL